MSSRGGVAVSMSISLEGQFAAKVYEAGPDTWRISVVQMNRTGTMLEVIACTVADAVEAEKGGANRLEVISDFASGGLTPPFELVREILAAVRIPVRVMLRESTGYTVNGAAEVERLCAGARELAGLRIDGLVLGFLREGEIDSEITGRILSCVPNLKATFHHAFEEARDQCRAIRLLKKHRQIDRILTGGGSGDWPEKIERLVRYEREARPEITILVGGELNKQAIKTIREATSVREFHIGRAARVPQHTDGVVQSPRVRELVSLIEAGSAECR